jgi:hypothetical protein
VNGGECGGLTLINANNIFRDSCESHGNANFDHPKWEVVELCEHDPDDVRNELMPHAIASVICGDI